MPVHPSEEEAPSGIFEKVAKDPSSTSESTASEHGRIIDQLSLFPSAALVRLAGRARKYTCFPISYQTLTANLIEHHENEHTPGKASAQDHQSKGPAIPMNMSGMSLAPHRERR